MNGRNVEQVIRVIEANVDLSDAPTIVPEPEIYMAIVGKRNAGKSTLVNAIAQLYEGDPERVIVSEVPGTTRDSVDVRFEKEGKSLVVIDTAGVRKKRHMVTNDIEFYSFHRAQRSIRRADVVMLLIDGIEHISEPDKKLVQYVAEQFKPVVLVVNKFDLVIERARQQAEEAKTGFSSELLIDEFEEYLRQELKHLDYAPVAFVTAKDGKNVQVVLDLAQHLFKQSSQRMTTSRLNQAVRQILQERTPSTPSGRKAKIFYATQIDTNPPTIALIVNKPEYIDETYQRFMLNRLRDLLPYPEVPIRLLVRPRGAGAGGAAKSLDERSAEEVRESGDRAMKTERAAKPRPKSRGAGPRKPSSRAKGRSRPRPGRARR
jgi:GTP-binding protein